MSKTKRYQWPASALTDENLMAQLHQISIATRKPITKLIREATERMIADIRDRMDNPEELRGAA